MKVLWIVNSVLNDLSLDLYGRSANGVWMDALLSDFKGAEGFEIVVATTAKRKDVYKVRVENVTYYLLPDAPPILYNENNGKNIEHWRSLLAQEKPDLIQVWGTEFTHGLCCLRQADGIPSVVYMQGYLGSIARFYLAGISESQLRKTVTLRDIIKRDSILNQRDKYLRSAKKEVETLSLAGNVICENDWCEANIRSIVPDIKVFRCPLNVNKVFFNREWAIEKVERHSVICNASGYTIKGLHVLLKAVSILKRRYPDIKLYVPGTKVVSDGSLKWFLRKRGYTKYIENLIRELKLEENVVWLGVLTQSDLADEYAKRHVFVMPSSIENHSSSLKEAMAVGMPCVSSFVGGVPEYLTHGVNGYLYRFEEYEVLADLVARLFVNDDVAIGFSKKAKEDMSKLHVNSDLFEKMVDIYSRVVGENK